MRGCPDPHNSPRFPTSSPILATRSAKFGFGVFGASSLQNKLNSKTRHTHSSPFPLTADSEDSEDIQAQSWIGVAEPLRILRGTPGTPETYAHVRRSSAKFGVRASLRSGLVLKLRHRNVVQAAVVYGEVTECVAWVARPVMKWFIFEHTFNFIVLSVILS